MKYYKHTYKRIAGTRKKFRVSKNDNELDARFEGYHMELAGERWVSVEEISEEEYKRRF